MTTQAPPAGALPSEPSAYPDARVVPPPEASDLVAIEAQSQTYKAGLYVLDGRVQIVYQDRTVTADHIEYDSRTGDVSATGHLVVTRGRDLSRNEQISASHGTYNLRTETGRFFDVAGSVGIARNASSNRTVYTNSSPFLFTGRVVVKTGADNFDVYDGTVTSCRLDHPDWLLSASHFSVDAQRARARNSVFRLLNMPLLFLPYVTHPIDAEQRESGFLIPTLGVSNQKGIIVGEQIYLAIDRSLDLTVGADFYSDIGFAQRATLRFRGAGLDMATLHYSGVLDRRAPSTNQGGEEVLFIARHDISPATRAAANIDYLSSYVFREAFSDNFNQAVTSDIVSTAYLAHAFNGIELAALADRYQGIKLIQQNITTDEIRIFHVPTLSLASTGHFVRGTASRFSNGLEVSLQSSASGLKRSQPPNFVTGGIIERFDLHPEAAYPITLGDWHFLPAVAARETAYSRSRVPNRPITQSPGSVLRSDFEVSLDIRPPVLTRTFQPRHLTGLLGSEFRHTIEPSISYRLTDGISNFNRLLRFDAIDVASNTNEVEYGVVQRLYRRPRANTDVSSGHRCATEQVASAPGFNSTSQDTPDDMSPEVNGDEETPAGRCPSEELIHWRVTQRYFFDQTFGGAVVNNRRNIFSSTLDLSGVSFLTEPRETSPIVSRLRFRTSAHTDVEWDFDLDAGSRKFNSSNVFLDLHQGNAFAALSYARLDAPGRFFTESPTTDPTGATTGVSSSISDFNQLRVLLGYGNPTKPGLSVAANAGIDLKHLYGVSSPVHSAPIYPPLLQYATVQASYNWNCCGIAIEYRKLELGSVRNDGTYRFNFTLANIGAAGNLRRAERLF